MNDYSAPLLYINNLAIRPGIDETGVVDLVLQSLSFMEMPGYGDFDRRILIEKVLDRLVAQVLLVDDIQLRAVWGGMSNEHHVVFALDFLGNFGSPFLELRIDHSEAVTLAADQHGILELHHALVEIDKIFEQPTELPKPCSGLMIAWHNEDGLADLVQLLEHDFDASAEDREVASADHPINVFLFCAV